MQILKVSAEFTHTRKKTATGNAIKQENQTRCMKFDGQV